VNHNQQNQRFLILVKLVSSLLRKLHVKNLMSKTYHQLDLDSYNSTSFLLMKRKETLRDNSRLNKHSSKNLAIQVIQVNLVSGQQVTHGQEIQTLITTRKKARQTKLHNLLFKKSHLSLKKKICFGHWS
jgi:hypothetical protein